MSGATTILLAVGVAWAAAACGRRPVPLSPTPNVVLPSVTAAGEWPTARTAAQRAMLDGDFAGADSLLRAFAARFPGTEPAVETSYWRALVLLDPAAEATASRDQLREARASLDAYIAVGPAQPHYAEALTLRRLAARVDSLRTSTEATRPVLGAQAARDSARARDEEMTRLRTELDQTKAELERIRRRLAPPRP